MLYYSVGSKNPVSHYLKVEAYFELPAMPDEVEIILPSWRPGRYEEADYAKNLHGLTVQDKKGNNLTFKRTSKNCWIVKTGGQDFKISYNYFAFQADAGASYIDDSIWIINPINCLIYPKGFENEACRFEINVPPQWEIATTLNKSEQVFFADNYFELTDRPLLSSGKIERHNYEVDGIPFSICTIGDPPINLDDLLPSFKAFSEVQLKMFNSRPFDKYYFLIVILPFRFYHGVEHADNTMLVLGIDEVTDIQKFKDDLLGVSSHELFHAWNIKKIRPKELQPYNFKSHTIFNTGMVAEGFTTYYGDLFLVRSGVWNIVRYLEEVNIFLKRHYRNPGRHINSLTTSSENLWLDGYKPGAPFHKVSIYVKGAIVTLMLDLTIRLLSDHKYSMDDIMRWLDAEKANGGYSLEEIKKEAERLAGNELDDFFEYYAYSTMPVEERLESLTGSFGLTLQKCNAENALERLYGIATALKEDILIVEMIDTGSPAEEQLSVADQLLLINNEKPNEFTNDKIMSADELHLKIKRLGRVQEVVLRKSGGPFFNYYKLVMNDNLHESQRNAMKRWLWNLHD